MPFQWIVLELFCTFLSNSVEKNTRRRDVEKGKEKSRIYRGQKLEMGKEEDDLFFQTRLQHISFDFEGWKRAINPIMHSNLQFGYIFSFWSFNI